MKYFYKCLCVPNIYNKHKIIVGELKEHKINMCNISVDVLLKYLEPLKITHPLAYIHYNNLQNDNINLLRSNKNIRTPSMIINSEEAYIWLLSYHSKLS